MQLPSASATIKPHCYCTVRNAVLISTLLIQQQQGPVQCLYNSTNGIATVAAVLIGEIQRSFRCVE
jgi:hypothetical protein